MIATFIGAGAIIASLLAVAYQVRSSRRQETEARRAEQIAAAFFDLYGGWALNRRAQLDPPDISLLRTSSAQFYTAAFRLSSLVEDAELDALRKFMASELGAADQQALRALSALHGTVTSTLGYRSAVVPTDVLQDMFWRSRRNVPGLRLGNVDPTTVEKLIADERAAAAK